MRTKVRAVLAAIVAPLLALGLVVGEGLTAQAAGSAQLLVSVVAVDASTGNPITSVTSSQSPRRIAFRVDFSCVTSDCTNATVKFDPTQLDPNDNTYRLLYKTGFTPPLSGGTVTGDDANGWTVTLGNLASGASGQFTLEYGWPALNQGWPTSFPYALFPDGFPIAQTVHGNADTASVVHDATTVPVTWHVAGSTPTIALQNLGIPSSGFFTTDTNITYQIRMTTGCRSDTNNFTYDNICSSAWTVTHQLPPGAVLVSADDNPTVTGSVSTGLILTWNSPAWTAANPGALWTFTGWAGNPRNVTITFPAANIAPAGQTCDFTTSFNGPTGRVDATYISMPGVPGATGTAPLPAYGPFPIKCTSPFPRAELDPKQSTYDGSARPATADATVVIPASGENDKEWHVTVANTANIPGVAVITDNTLDLPDLPVYQIAAPAGSTITWTATDGTTTRSGTSTGTANAPAGFRFVTSTVTSPTLAPSNQIREQTYRTTFTVAYRYRVTPDATNPTMRRINTASAVMQWPGHSEFPDTVLGSTSGAVTLIAPFGRISAWKGGYMSADVPGGVVGGNNNDHPSGSVDLTIPTSPTSFWWNAWVVNSGNAPAIATITDTTLDDPEIPITQLQALTWSSAGGCCGGIPSDFQVTLDDGTVETKSNVTVYNAPAGRRIASYTATTVTAITGGSTTPADGGWNSFIVSMVGSVGPTATPNSTHSNTFTGSLDYRNPSVPNLTAANTFSVHLVGSNPVMTATLGPPTVAGGATQATTTTDVTFTLGGSTAQVPLTRDITPEYVLMAPAGWNITPGSASFPVGSVPPGVTFGYRTVTIAGVDRQVVVATWPAGTSFGKNTTLPNMSVIARPSTSVAAGAVGVPRGFITNTGTLQPADTFTHEFTDTPDIDGNAATTRFSEAPAVTGVPVAAVAAMQVLKEICLPDASKLDGCQWFADPNNRVGVPPNSTSIRYRLTVTNTGNTDLSDAVGYDILPYPGDTGTSDATSGTPRGSTLTENVDSVSNLLGSPSVSYSASTQPCRPEVNPNVANCANDWQGSALGAQAIRISRAGTLAPGQYISMQYSTAVLNSPGNGAVGCNSLAVRVTGLSNVSEPAPVCASIEETDLAITAGTPLLQIGRPGILPWTVVNNGGAASTQGNVTVTIPAGLSATSLQFSGWRCTGADANGNPQYGTAVGPSTLTCTPDSPLLKGVPQQLDVPVVSTVSTFTSAAHVSGRLYDGNLANNDATMSATAAPPAGDIGVAKDDGVTTAKPGDTLTYRIPVHNPLLYETLTGARLTDVIPGGLQFVSASDGGTYDASTRTLSWALPDMPGDGSATRTVTVTVLSTVASATLKNTAMVTAPDPANPSATFTGTATDTDTVRTNPAITLTKSTAQPTYSKVGDTVSYTFSSTNTGDVTLQNVAIADPLPGLSALTYGTWPSGTAGMLAPGQTVTATATYTIAQADMDATKVTNTATVGGKTPSGADVTARDTHTVSGTAAPSILLDKRTTSTVSRAGDVVAYSFTVTNTSLLTLQNVSITDPLSGLSPITFGAWPGTAGTLAPGQSVTATATYKATQADVNRGSIDNTATVTGTTVGGATLTDEHAAVVTITPAPAIGMTKGSVEAAFAKAGDQVHYTFAAQNTGNVTLTGVVITDPRPGLGLITYSWPGAAGTLAPGETVTAAATYTITQADVDATSVTNNASVTGTPPAGSDVTATATRTINGTATQSILLDKQTASIVSRAGDVVTYDFTVTNTSPLTLNDVTITDPLPGLSTITYRAWPGSTGVLKPGEKVTATATYTATQADVDAHRIDNTATVTGATNRGATATDQHTATVTISEAPAISLTKDSLETSFTKAGDTVHYTFAASNTGNVTLTGVAISDPLPGLSGITYAWPGAAGVLAPGQKVTASATYTVSQADVDATKGTNTATATGTSPAGANVKATATRTIDGTATPTIALDKQSASVVRDAGDPVTYTFTVTNTSALTLRNVTITDPMPRLSSLTFGAWPGAAGVLAPGQSVIATATYTASQADVDAGRIDNTATAKGTTLGGATATDRHSAEILINRTPAITLHKTGAYDPGTRGDAGDQLRYGFTVTNAGNTTLTNVTITDPLAGLTRITYTWPGAPGVLLPGQAATATASRTVTQADVDGLRGVTNTATVTSDAPDGTHPTAQDTVHMPTPANSGVQLVKTGTLDDTGHAPRAGDTVTYRLAATNLGAVTLHDDTITDPMPGLSPLTFTWPGTPGELAPGQTVTATGRYTLTQADVDASKVLNTATTTGIDPAQNTVTAQATFTLVLPADAKLTLTKTGAIADGYWKAGMRVDYGFTAENTGNVTLTDVVIADPLPGLSTIVYTWPGQPGVLAPGEKVTAKAAYLLTADDVAKRTVTNTATASSDRAPDATDSVTLTGPTPPLVIPDPPTVGDLLSYLGDPSLARTGGTIPMLPIAGGILLLGAGLVLALVARRGKNDGSAS
ncbi:DUF7507 domain-containing protein [Microbacterium sp. ASV81]|uniref:Uncharacterized protein n=1 Tax=Microbacterium capsulatum TaxID=3041921 RepID=A0ABU0XFC2_9MICO|nr:hypothetical protein [Microbacterium sp. ASV81]MDQ4213819.1 hypothetical protein [Microbacterium sp. ASV81]